MPLFRQDQASPKWMEYARRSMQRFGFLKWVLTLASASHAQSLESLTRAFYLEVTTVKPIDPEVRQAFERYVCQQQLHSRYSDKLESAQIQDLLLSNSILPSHSGAITGELERTGYRHAVYVEIPAWAVRLKLLRQQSYTLTDRGRVLLLAGKSQPQTASQPKKENPFLLDLAERYVSLYCMLDVDGDLLSGMYQRLLELESFTRSHAGNMAVAALEELRRGRLKNASVGRMQQMRVKLDRVVASVSKQNYGGLGPRQSIATPRTEPLVDCGILAKPYVGKYEYTFTRWGKSFLTTLVSAESVSHFLEHKLSQIMSELTNQVVGATATLDCIEQAYNHLRSGIGYVSLRELAVLGVAQSLKLPSKNLFEIDSIERVIRRAAVQGNRDVRLAVGRMGGIAQVRIHSRAFKKNESTD